MTGQKFTEVKRAALVDEWSREPNLDFMRACAVLCVVGRHLIGLADVGQTWWLQPQALGIFGVVVFFLHTSLVLMMSLDRQQRGSCTSWNRLYASFLVRRVFRIYPLSIVAVLVTYFVMIPHADSGIQTAGIELHANAHDLIANLLLIQDVAGRQSILGPLWSLPAEVQMYLLLPAFYFASRAWGGRAILFGVWPLSVLVAAATWKLDPHSRFTVGRYAPCFVAGVLCSGWLRIDRPLPFWLFPITIATALLGYMTAYGRFGLQAGFGILVTLGLAFLLPLFARMGSTWLRGASHVIAKYSYGIYLFHPSCIWLAFVKLSFLKVWGSALCFVILVGTVSFVVFHVIEDPLIRVGQALAARMARLRVASGVPDPAP